MHVHVFTLILEYKPTWQLWVVYGLKRSRLTFNSSMRLCDSSLLQSFVVSYNIRKGLLAVKVHVIEEVVFLLNPGCLALGLASHPDLK